MLKYISDLHLEYKLLNNQTIKNIYSNKINPTKYLALIGDIGNFNNDNLVHFIKYCSQNYDKIIYVPGNHEYWSNNKYTMQEIKNKLQELCTTNNVLFLDNNICKLHNITFIGSTLWSSINFVNNMFIKNGNYKNIHIDKSKLLTSTDTNLFNKQAIEYIQNRITNSTDKTVLLTHYPPIYCKPSLNQYTSDPSYFGKPSYKPYHNNIEHIIKEPIKVCIYGHTHYNGEFNRNNILYVSNQLSSKSGPSFSLSKCINLEAI